MTTVAIINDLVSRLEFTGTISSIDASNPTSVIIFSCNTGHVAPGDFVKINGADYKVISVDVNVSFTIASDPSPATEFVVPAPKFFHGTPLQVETILSNISDYRDKLPMVYLVEPYSETNYADRTKKIDRDFRGTLLFVMAEESLDDTVEESYPKFVEPLDNLIDSFVNLLTFDAQIENFDTYETTNRVNVGMWVSKDGRRSPMKDNIKKLFDERITAIEMIPSFSIKKDYRCCSS